MLCRYTTWLSCGAVRLVRLPCGVSWSKIWTSEIKVIWAHNPFQLQGREDLTTLLPHTQYTSGTGPLSSTSHELILMSLCPSGVKIPSEITASSTSKSMYNFPTFFCEIANSLNFYHPSAIRTYSWRIETHQERIIVDWFVRLLEGSVSNRLALCFYLCNS